MKPDLTQLVAKENAKFFIQGDCLMMEKFGIHHHSLWLGATTTERALAHWEGFTETLPPRKRVKAIKLTVNQRELLDAIVAAGESGYVAHGEGHNILTGCCLRRKGLVTVVSVRKDVYTFRATPEGISAVSEIHNK